MRTFLFWNTGNNPLIEIISELAITHNIDILMLTECSSINPSKLLMELNKTNQAKYHYSSSLQCERIQIFTSFSEQFISPKIERDRFTIRHLNLPGSIDILLAVIFILSVRTVSETNKTESIKRH
jgi:hypothetical protein